MSTTPPLKAPVLERPTNLGSRVPTTSPHRYGFGGSPLCPVCRHGVEKAQCRYEAQSVTYVIVVIESWTGLVLLRRSSRGVVLD